MSKKGRGRGRAKVRGRGRGKRKGEGEGKGKEILMTELISGQKNAEALELP